MLDALMGLDRHYMASSGECVKSGAVFVFNLPLELGKRMQLVLVKLPYSRYCKLCSGSMILSKQPRNPQIRSFDRIPCRREKKPSPTYVVASSGGCGDHVPISSNKFQAVSTGRRCFFLIDTMGLIQYSAPKPISVHVSSVTMLFYSYEETVMPTVWDLYIKFIWRNGHAYCARFVYKIDSWDMIKHRTQLSLVSLVKYLCFR